MTNNQELAANMLKKWNKRLSLKKWFALVDMWADDMHKKARRSRHTRYEEEKDILRSHNIKV
jgi:hypothetical protein